MQRTFALAVTRSAGLGMLALAGAAATTVTAAAQQSPIAAPVADRVADQIADPGGQPIEVTGSISEVTVYRGRAMVSRAVTVDAQPGLREIVVTNLPAHVVPGSLYAEADNGVQVRSLTYRERPVEADVREEVEQMESRIAQIEEQMRANQNQQELLAKQSAYLDRVETFTATTAVSDLSHGVLEPDAVQNVSTYLFAQRERIAERGLALQEAARELQRQLALAQRERTMITGTASHTVREAVLYLDVAEANAVVHVHYLVEHASWSPSYTARLHSETGELRLEYLASIEQRSGEAWNDVRMSLSTATPTLTARAPELEPFTLSLESMEQQAEKLSMGYEQLRQQIDDQKAWTDSNRNIAGAQVLEPGNRVAMQGQATGGGFGGGGGGGPGSASGAIADRGAAAPWQTTGEFNLKNIDLALNDLACQLQVLEFTAATKAVHDPRSTDQRRSESISVTYELPSRISLASRPGQQLVSVRKLDLDAEAYRIATPVLTDYIYVEAAARNDSDLVLLAGPTSSYLDGDFVGRSELPSIASGEKFTTGFGVDSSLRASRALIDTREEILGGNRVVEINYRLTVESFNGGDVPIRLFDRIPTADDKKVKISLVSTSVPLSDDAQYLNTERSKGILRWDLASPAHDDSAAGVTTIEYTLRLEYDKNMSLAGTNPGEDAG